MFPDRPGDYSLGMYVIVSGRTAQKNVEIFKLLVLWRVFTDLNA